MGSFEYLETIQSTTLQHARYGETARYGTPPRLGCLFGMTLSHSVNVSISSSLLVYQTTSQNLPQKRAQSQQPHAVPDHDPRGVIQRHSRNLELRLAAYDLQVIVTTADHMRQSE